ncbi:MAG: hypothetical protein LBJ02_11110 [Bifidobacteriaceae bacterium]|jgi:hypothetical protein|nr:hypothetical protein [Bifidobacteriaceae bacterium]
MLTTLAGQIDLDAVAYVPIGTRRDIKFTRPQTDVTIDDTPITVAGEVRWNGWQSVPSKASGGSVRFELPQNWATGASSDSVDHVAGSSVRDFVVKAACDGDERQYAFGLRTDPAGAR